MSTVEEPDSLQQYDELLLVRDFSQATIDGPLPIAFDGLHWQTAVERPYLGMEYVGSEAAATMEGNVVARGYVEDSSYIEAGERLQLFVSPPPMPIEGEVAEG